MKGKAEIVKREFSDTPTPPSSPTPISFNSNPSSGKKRKVTEVSNSPKKSKSAHTPTTDWSQVEGLTPEKKGALIERLLSAGAAVVGTANLAEEFGLTKTQVNNAISAGKKNLRSKIIEAAMRE